MFNEFNLECDTPEELTTKLIKYALEGRHSKKEILKNCADLTTARTLRTAISQIIQGFEQASSAAYNNYIKNKTEANVDLLLSYITYEECCKFYQKELLSIIDEINEFYNYLRVTRSFIKVTLCGYERPKEDLIDSRIA